MYTEYPDLALKQKCILGYNVYILYCGEKALSGRILSYTAQEGYAKVGILNSALQTVFGLKTVPRDAFPHDMIFERSTVALKLCPIYYKTVESSINELSWIIGSVAGLDLGSKPTGSGSSSQSLVQTNPEPPRISYSSC